MAIHAVNGSNPGATALYTLTALSGTGSGHRTFTALAGASLSKGTSYFAVVAGPSGNTRGLDAKNSDAEGAGGVTEWSVVNVGRFYFDGPGMAT